MNKATTLVWYCKTPRGWRRFPVIEENGRVKAGHVLDHGTETHYPQGRFELRQYKGRRLVYTAVKTSDPIMAAIERRRQARIALIKGGVEDSRKLIRKAAKLYIADCINRKAMEAAEQARLVTDEFLHVCNGNYVDAVTREDVFRFHKTLRARGCSDRTVANKHERLKSFLRFAGADVSKFPPRPKYELALPTIYTPAEVGSILDAADGTMRIAIEMALKLGLREQEVVYAEWGDVDWGENVYRVQGKPHWKFKVKDSEQRDVPLPADLLETLREWQTAHPKTRLIVGTASDSPNSKLLRTLKRLAKRAGLNCGKCDGCKAETQECENWTLHKFRRTYCTAILRNGVDLRTAQAWMGHSDVSSTMRYLRPATGKETQTRVNAIQWR